MWEMWWEIKTFMPNAIKTINTINAIKTINTIKP